MWRSSCRAAALASYRSIYTSPIVRAGAKRRVKRRRPVAPSDHPAQPQQKRVVDMKESSVFEVEAIVNGREASPAARTAAGALTSSSTPSPELHPDAVDYRALLLDLLLYRKETVTPVLKTLVEERRALESRMRALDAKIAHLAHVREEIRVMLEEHSATEELRLLRAVEQLQGAPKHEAAVNTTAPARSPDAVDEGRGDVEEEIVL